MTSRERFIKTMTYGEVDRPPLFEEGIREEVWEVWRTQGAAGAEELSRKFHYDRHDEIDVNLDPRPSLPAWPGSMDLAAFHESLELDDPGRFPVDWQVKLDQWKRRDYPLFLRVHNGFFLTMGVEAWDSFAVAIRLVVDEPGFVQDVMAVQGEFNAKMAEKILGQVEVEAVVFSEPIGGNHGPLISPRMYREIVLKSYAPILEVVRRHRVQTIILRSYANERVLLPEMVKFGINCLWACETNPEAMDYRRIRREYGKELRLIGGIDTDILRYHKEDIQRELEEKVLPLLPEGGFIPLADGRVREDMSFENYIYYRSRLEELVRES